MAALSSKIREIRNAVCGILRIRQRPNNQTDFAIVGTAWCISNNQYFVTAHHVLNDGNPRNPSDKFLLIRRLNNGEIFDNLPVVNFPLEERQNDYAVLEVSIPDARRINIPPLRVSFRAVPDGTEVLTYGCPAPRVTGVSRSGSSVNFAVDLVARADRGIVSAQLPLKVGRDYVFTVHWFNGESGGPVLDVRTLRVIAIMQRQQNIDTGRATVPGPRLGRSLSAVQNELSRFLPAREIWWRFW